MKKQKKSLKEHSPSKAEHSIGNIDSYLGYWLRFVSNQVTASFQNRLSEKNVTVAEWIALRFLYAYAPCSLTKLADEMGMNKGALSRLTDRMEKRGLIRRNISKHDKRFFSIELTPEGTHLVPQLAKIADENDAFFFDHLSKEESEYLFKFLKAMVNKYGFKSKPVD